MKRQQFYLPQSGKLVTQLPRGITFVYDLRLGHLRDRWKGLTEEYNVGIHCKNDAKKTSFSASKQPWKFRTWKTTKKLPIWNNCFDLLEWWVATDIHLDQSSPLRRKWSPLHWVPPLDGETSIELDYWWAIFLGGVATLLWPLDRVGSVVCGFPWPMCP